MEPYVYQHGGEVFLAPGQKGDSPRTLAMRSHAIPNAYMLQAFNC